MSPSVARTLISDIAVGLGADPGLAALVPYGEANRRWTKRGSVELVVMRARVVMYLRDHYGMSFPEIADAMGAKSHATIIRAYRMGTLFVGAAS